MFIIVGFFTRIRKFNSYRMNFLLNYYCFSPYKAIFKKFNIIYQYMGNNQSQEGGDVNRSFSGEAYMERPSYSHRPRLFARHQNSNSNSIVINSIGYGLYPETDRSNQLINIFDSFRPGLIDVDERREIIEFIESHQLINRMPQKEPQNLKPSKKAILKQVTTKKYKKTKENITAEECCICLEDFTPKLMMGILRCGHQFHKKCIGSWLEKDCICPLCRLRIL